METHFYLAQRWWQGWEGSCGKSDLLGLLRALAPKPNQDWTMSNASLTKWLISFLFRMSSKATVWSMMSFPCLCFRLVLVLKSMAIQNSKAISRRTCRSTRMGSPSLSSQGLTSLVWLGYCHHPDGRNLLWRCLFYSPPWVPKGSPDPQPAPAGQSC